MPELQSAGDLYRAGRLADAIVAATAAVRAAPAALPPRVLLAELLLFDGNLERADTVLDAAAALAPDAAVVVAEFRQLLRAETARRQVRRDGRVPDFLGEPTPALASLLAARVALRAGDEAQAAAHAAAAEASRPRLPGRLDATTFDDARDACDLHAGLVEVLTTTGKYFWLPAETIESATFHPPLRPRDLYWRRATLVVRDGPDGEIYVPGLYGADDVADDGLKLGRATDWVGEGELVTGRGARTWLIGDQEVALQSIGTVEFAP